MGQCVCLTNPVSNRNSVVYVAAFPHLHPCTETSQTRKAGTAVNGTLPISPSSNHLDRLAYTRFEHTENRISVKCDVVLSEQARCVMHICAPKRAPKLQTAWYTKFAASRMTQAFGFWTSETFHQLRSYLYVIIFLLVLQLCTLLKSYKYIALIVFLSIDFVPVLLGII